MMICDRVTFSGHAVQRMFERGIQESEVRKVLFDGEIIAEYPDDKPFQSFLISGWTNAKTIHIVVGVDREKNLCYVITVYLPDPLKWEDDFKKKRRLF